MTSPTVGALAVLALPGPVGEADPVLLALVTGGFLGASIWLLIVAALRPPANLAAAAARWQLRRDRYPRAEEEVDTTAKARLGRWLMSQARRRGLVFTSMRADLALIDRSLEEHLVSKVLLAGFGLLLPSGMAAVLASFGVSVPVLGGVVVGLVLAALFFVVPDLSVAEQAAHRRADLRRALACYLDLVAMSLAGGRGVPEALPSAAEIGQGWGFELLGRTVAAARTSGVTPWVALGELGQRTGIAELQDLGSALGLVASDGAKVRESLKARASSQRRRQLAEAEGDAQRASQSMSKAQLVLALGFLVFLGYPALINVLAI
jgi:tight adherence protein C